MELTHGQELALKAVREVSRSHPKGGGIVVINGSAGCGKTSLLRVLAEDEDLTVLAPTGKAALRAKEVAPSVNASTIHRWLYQVDEDPETGKLLTTLKDDVLIPENKLIFVDEASMVPFTIARDLYKTCKEKGLNLIFIGDSFQLPPVDMNEANKDFSVLASDFPAHHRVHMTEVVRQAMDSPIIRASIELRSMKSDLKELSSLPCIPTAELAEYGAKVFEDGGVTICHRNATRHTLNSDIRKVLGYGEKVVKGEPFMVLYNNYDIDVYNGEIVEALTEPVLLGTKPVPIRDRFCNETMNMWFYQTMINTPAGRSLVLFADQEIYGTSGKIGTKMIRKGGQDYSRYLMVQERKEESGSISYSDLNKIKGLPVLNCNFGYASTCHRYQGSECNTGIVVIEDSIRLHSHEGRRFLYTSLTRFKKSVKICWA